MGRVRRRVAVVTGGGRGIGAAIADELARSGAHVVTVDPLVALDGGADPAAEQEPTTAERIVAAGGSAQASTASVTDRHAITELFGGLAAEFGGVDAVVNVAGISRPTSFTAGTESDWRDVLSVHLDGYCTVLSAALPHMAETGRGSILGVTSGAGWRAADAGAYSGAKRAVAALTWQLGAAAPPGVSINALSPIAMTRMVAAAMSRAQSRPGSGSATGRSAPGSRSGGLSLGTAMPAPEALAPLAAHLVDEGRDWFSGNVIFAGGSELAVVEPPRWLEVARVDGGLATALDELVVGAFAPAEAAQASAGGSTPRFPAAHDPLAGEPVVAPAGGTCAVLVEHAGLAAAITAALRARGVTAAPADFSSVRPGFDGAIDALRVLERRGDGDLDAVIVAPPGGPAAAGSGEWEGVLADHDGLAASILGDAAWARAVSDHSASNGRAIRLVTLTDATTPAGASRAQAVAQLARAALGATERSVAAFAVALESRDEPVAAAALAAHLACHPDAALLCGAELAAGAGWVGLRSHPRPATSIVYGGPAVPVWLDEVLGAATGGTGG